MRGTDRLITAILLTGGLLLVGPAWAQQSEEARVEAETQEMARSANSTDDPLPYAWQIGGGVGQMSGATPVGGVDNIFFTTGFQTGSATMFNVRASGRFWWRLGAEIEYGRAEPGIDALLTDPNGQQLTEFFFAEYSQSYLSVSARVDLVDARITPFLLGGFAGVFSSGEEDSDTNAGFLFGGGIDVAVYGPLVVRADVKGLRSNVDAAGLTRGRQITGVPPVAPPVSTQVLWSIGIGIRF